MISLDQLSGNGAEILRKDAPLAPLIEVRSVDVDLIAAAESGDHEGVSRALGKGAEITYRGSHGDTGLHIGAMNGNDSVVKTFLEAGINVDIKDEADTKWTALIAAAKSPVFRYFLIKEQTLT